MRSAHERFSPEWWAWMTMPEPNTGCHLWMGCVCREGRGRVSMRGKSPVLAHRIAYEQAYGPIPDRKHVLHRCDTPSCVNPDHLFIGTQRDNMRDMFAKGRGRPHGTGKATLRLVTAPVAVRELASETSDESVRIDYALHLTRTSAMLAGWRHVTGVPKRQPTRALVPLTLSPKLDRWLPKTPDSQLPTVATVAGCCPSSPLTVPASRALDGRRA